MSKTPLFPPHRPREIGVVVFPCFQLLDAAGPISAFEIATHFAPNAYRLRLLAGTGGMIASSSGVSMPTTALKGLRLAQIDTLIVVGGQGTRGAAQDAALLATLQRASTRVRRMASVCSGSFVLAAAGLLDGKRATTHWRQAPLMQSLYPGVRVEPDNIYVKQGAVWTSAGVSAGIDLALAMIAEDLGADVAKNVAREMVVYAQRPGGQTQHSTLLDLDSESRRFAALHDWMRAHLTEALSVEQLARQAAMSERNFARAYVRETGMTPAKAVERMRVEAARAALEGANVGVQEVARRAGFGDAERMRRAFLRIYGAPPAALRRTARHA